MGQSGHENPIYQRGGPETAGADDDCEEYDD